jgi:hypothetical protein
MEEIYIVRRRHFVDGAPIRQLAREFGRSRKAIRRYLRSAEPIGKPRGVPGAPVRDALKPRIEDSRGFEALDRRHAAADRGAAARDVARREPRRRSETVDRTVDESGR